MTEDRRVQHPQHGHGTVIRDRDGVSTVELDDGRILNLPTEELQDVASADAALRAERWGQPLEACLRVLALAIRSTSERWGVFAPSRVTLLPHQLWVCHRVLSRWPSRWIIADDVGLGKTIEAGLILTPLLGRRHVRRLLVIAPAGLVDQWVERLREMFDIRAARYVPAADRPRDDFWQTNTQVVASLQTLRLDNDDRWERMREAEPWDLVLVDEAHHLGASEDGGRTLGLRLVEELDARCLIRGLLLFTGTPHRGKDFGFLSLLRLTDPAIDPKEGLGPVLPHLHTLMIRNNKQSVTDMAGRRLFQPSTVTDIRYAYTTEEARFYDRLTEFILTGRAYASRQQLGTQRSVMLVLTTMQKLAASSIAAVRRALEGRLARLRSGVARASSAQAKVNDLWRQLLSADADGMDPDLRVRLEEQINELMDQLQLNPDEIPALEELVALAGEVRVESRVTRLLELIEGWGPQRSVLLFTEYKATQALVLSALARRHGRDQVTFINGDGALTVDDGLGGTEVLREDRRAAAERFNMGRVRFLVSTEAAGEGIDLQLHCHTLIHVDLPWNPMRMHQRVGRLNRYGQTQPVHVNLLRNPATVEGRIWECLEEKLHRISLAFVNTMADPEDIRLLVLGMTAPSFHEQLAARALAVEAERFDAWYDAETVSFAGTDAVATVSALLGSAARFDFAVDAPGIPRVDLPSLRPFIRAALRLRGRRLEERPDGSFVFNTPAEWASAHPAIRDRYEAHLDRHRERDRRGPALLGAGHRLLETIIDDVGGLGSAMTRTPDIATPLVIFSAWDTLSAPDAPVRRVILGARGTTDDRWEVLADWEVVLAVSAIVERPDRVSMRLDSTKPAEEAGAAVNAARATVIATLPALKLPFRRPDVRLEAVLWPE